MNRVTSLLLSVADSKEVLVFKLLEWRLTEKKRKLRQAIFYYWLTCLEDSREQECLSESILYLMIRKGGLTWAACLVSSALELHSLHRDGELLLILRSTIAKRTFWLERSWITFIYSERTEGFQSYWRHEGDYRPTNELVEERQGLYHTQLLSFSCLKDIPHCSRRVG